MLLAYACYVQSWYDFYFCVLVGKEYHMIGEFWMRLYAIQQKTFQFPQLSNSLYVLILVYITSNNFIFYFSCKYCSSDVACIRTCGFMAPYHNVRYWLAIFRNNCHPKMKEELNHTHARLRNVTKLIFGY